jgi:hypothetical protein
MLNHIAVILMMAWALGMITECTLGGLLHVLLLIVAVFVCVRIIQDRSVCIEE